MKSKKVKRLTLAEERALARTAGYEAGRREGSSGAYSNMASDSKIQLDQSKVAVINAAAELGQANAKLAYALSRIINKDGW